jgi:hypothetical protein
MALFQSKCDPELDLGGLPEPEKAQKMNFLESDETNSIAISSPH